MPRRRLPSTARTSSAPLRASHGAPKGKGKAKGNTDGHPSHMDMDDEGEGFMDEGLEDQGAGSRPAFEDRV